MPSWIPKLIAYGDWALDWLAAHAPIVTAVIAIMAASVALRSLHSQREIARKRAAIDVFFKTEMDEKMLIAHKAYSDARDSFNKLQLDAVTFRKAQRAHYEAIRAYLNVHELIAVGVNQCVFDEDVCYEFWGNELLRAYKAVEPIITEMRERPDGLETYEALATLQKRWLDRATAGRAARIKATTPPPTLDPSAPTPPDNP